MAGSPCPIEVMKQCVDRMHMSDVTICYGMTETSPVSTQTLPDDSLHHRTATVGRVHPHVEIRDRRPRHRRDASSAASRASSAPAGYSVMQGYWNDPERTADAIDADGWMHTGDLAVMADDGYVNIVGRIKDMVIRGGENVYPREIEEFLYTHPAVADVQVIGVPDERYGEELMAWVKLQPGASATEDEIREFCRGKIAHFKIPRYVRFVDEFPMTVTGKVQKYLMREQSIADLGLAPAADDRLTLVCVTLRSRTRRDLGHADGRPTSRQPSAARASSSRPIPGRSSTSPRVYSYTLSPWSISSLRRWASRLALGVGRVALAAGDLDDDAEVARS